jgi:hypothetical protein
MNIKIFSINENGINGKNIKKSKFLPTKKLRYSMSSGNAWDLRRHKESRT